VVKRYRFYTDGAVDFVTFSVVGWLPVFVSDSACKIVTESLNFCHDNKGLRTNAYATMPTHLHTIPNRLRPNRSGSGNSITYMRISVEKDW